MRIRTPVNGNSGTRVIHLEEILHRFTFPIIALLLAYSGCSVNTLKFYVSNPSANAIFLAPDLPTLAVLLASNATTPATAIPIPNGAKGLMLDRKFFKGDRLVDPYPANSFDMEKDSAIEVALFEVTEGPKRGAKGWLRMSLLRPDFWYL